MILHIKKDVFLLKAGSAVKIKQRPFICEVCMMRKTSYARQHKHLMHLSVFPTQSVGGRGDPQRCNSN